MIAQSKTRMDIENSVLTSISSAQAFDLPYRYYLISNFFPGAVASELASLSIAAPMLDGVSGKRELHNDQRSYFDVANMQRFDVMADVAAVLQSQPVVDAIAKRFDAPIDDTFLRLEYAVDSDGFWLQPHTDLGVKKFTCLIYLSDGPGHEKLGTDIYASPDKHVGAPAFLPNAGLIFVPGSDTWHGFEKRPIIGERKSMIFNYVTHDWRAREQLSFPQTPIRVGAMAH